MVTLTGPALIEYIHKAEASQDQTASIFGLLTLIRNGEVDVLEVREHYKRQDTPKLNSMVTKFSQGNLFQCQRQDFNAWVSAIGYHEDLQQGLEFKATCVMCGINPDEQEVWLFVQLMIFQVGPFRRQKDAEEYGDSMMRRWSQTLRDHKWDWTS